VDSPPVFFAIAVKKLRFPSHGPAVTLQTPCHWHQTVVDIAMQHPTFLGIQIISIDFFLFFAAMTNTHMTQCSLRICAISPMISALNILI